MRQGNLIQELMLNGFELDHNAVGAIKNICCMKGEGVIDHSTVTNIVQEILLGLQEPQ